MFYMLVYCELESEIRDCHRKCIVDMLMVCLTEGDEPDHPFELFTPRGQQEISKEWCRMTEAVG